MSLQQVHLRINDAATGQPTPVRLRITDAAGTYYAPFGRLTEFATGVNQDVGGNVEIAGKKWCYIDGTSEILLPPDKLHIEISKGFEFKPIAEEITLLAGKMSLRFTIERWCDMRKEGWYSGDTRVHFMSPDAALLEGQAEDVAVVNLLACESWIVDEPGRVPRKAIPNIIAFSGQSFARQTPTCGVAVNTYNQHVMLGSLGLLHCHRAVFPLAADGPDWTLDDWAGQCHRKKGLVVWTHHIHVRFGDFPSGRPLPSLINGNIDAVEWTWADESESGFLRICYRLVDAGFHFPFVGASGKEENMGELGSMRTYAFVGSTDLLTYSNWVEAVRRGRTFVSNGPLLRFTVENAESQPVIAVAEARSVVPFSSLELIGNGEVIAAVAPDAKNHARLEFDLPAKFEGWIALRCLGTAAMPNGQVAFAHTSPVRVGRDCSSSPRRIDAIRELMKKLEGMEIWAREESYGRFLHDIESARTILAKKLAM